MTNTIISAVLGIIFTFIIPTSVLLFGIFFIYEVFIRFRK
jgi:hypothetical protein